MPPLPPPITELASSAAAEFAPLVVRGTLLLALAGVALLLTRRRASAAVRHLVLTCTLVALLLLPLASALTPAWNFVLLPGTGVAAEFLSPETLAPPVVVAETAAPPDENPAAPAPPAVGAHAAAAPPAPEPSRPGFPLLPPLFVHAAGVLALLAREVAGGLKLRALARASADAPESVRREAGEAARALGVRRPVAVRLGAPGAPPMTWGTLRPVLLLPADAPDSWPAARLRAALLHEMAHVSRWDALTQTLARLTRALWWWHPLAWVAVRAQRAESERACDDRVLLAGVAGAEYAEHLLAVARSLRGRRSLPMPAVAMARPAAKPAPLKRRLLAVLDARLPRRAVTRRGAVIGGLVAAALLAPLAALRLITPPPPALGPVPEIVARSGEAVTLSNGSTVRVKGILIRSGDEWLTVQPDGSRDYVAKGRQDDSIQKSIDRDTTHIIEFEVSGREQDGGRQDVTALFRGPGGYTQRTVITPTVDKRGRTTAETVRMVAALRSPGRSGKVRIGATVTDRAVVAATPLPGRVVGRRIGPDMNPTLLTLEESSAITPELLDDVVPAGAPHTVLRVDVPPPFLPVRVRNCTQCGSHDAGETSCASCDSCTCCITWDERFAKRFVLIDWAGRSWHPSIGTTTETGQTEYLFVGIPPRKARAVQLQVRRFQWVEFRDVPLAPPRP